MVHNILDTTVLMGLHQLARNYFQISLSGAADVATTGHCPGLRAPGRVRSSQRPSPDHRVNGTAPLHDSRFFPSLPCVDREPGWNDDRDDMIPPSCELKGVALDAHFDGSFCAAFPQETINKIHQTLKNVTDTVG